jgi:hypothetical protein
LAPIDGAAIVSLVVMGIIGIVGGSVVELLEYNRKRSPIMKKINSTIRGNIRLMVDDFWPDLLNLSSSYPAGRCTEDRRGKIDSFNLTDQRKM